MPVADRVRTAAFRLTDPDNPTSLAGRARARRWSEFARRFTDVEDMSVLDLGGTPRFWRTSPFRPRSVTIVNLIGESCDEQWIEMVVGDATEPPVDHSYDLVFSNSLIEHLPGERRQAFAKSVRRLGRRYWIQTPNRHFPVEPHWLFPGAQYLGKPARRWLAKNWPPSHFALLPDEIVEQEVENIDLLTAADLRSLFPGAEVWRERVGPLTKSLVAVG